MKNQFLFKNTLFTLVLICNLLLIASCKSKNDIVPDANASYVRIINASSDVTASDYGYTMFYMDGFLNGNPTKFNPDDFAIGGIREREDTILHSAFEFGIGKSIDVKSSYQPGIYRAGDIPASDFSSGSALCFPNLTNHVKLAPIINDIDFYKWANVSAGSHSLLFKHLINESGNSSLDGKIDTLLNSSHFFEKSGVYTLLLAKVNTGPKDFNIVSIKEPTDKTFEQKKAYVRFVNFVHKSIDDPDLTNNTRILDVYYTKTIKNSKGTKDSTTKEILLSNNLARFNVSEDQAGFSEIDMSEIFAFRKDSVVAGKYQKPVYNFYFYKSGESAIKGSAPVVATQFTVGNVNSLFPLYLVTPDGPQTTITTVAFDIIYNYDHYEVSALTYNLERKNSVDAYYK